MQDLGPVGRFVDVGATARNTTGSAISLVLWRSGAGERHVYLMRFLSTRRRRKEYIDYSFGL